MNRETIKVMEFINSCAIQWLISCNVDTSSTEKVLAVPKITTLDAKWVWNLFPFGQVRIWVICALRHLEERNICSQGLWELVTSLTNGICLFCLFSIGEQFLYTSHVGFSGQLRFVNPSVIQSWQKKPPLCFESLVTKSLLYVFQDSFFFPWVVSRFKSKWKRKP